MDKLDTYDTLKNGYIPIENLLAYAKKEKFNIDNFMENDIDEYIYSHNFELVYDGDFYNLSCYICDPNEDNDCVTVNFWADAHFNTHEEKRKLPVFPDTENTFEIRTREDFVNALNQWQYFVGEAYMRIMRHRLEVIEDLDEIIEAELLLPEFNRNNTKRLMYKNYNHCFNYKLINEMTYSIEDICNFNK